MQRWHKKGTSVAASQGAGNAQAHLCIPHASYNVMNTYKIGKMPFCSTPDHFMQCNATSLMHQDPPVVCILSHSVVIACSAWELKPVRLQVFFGNCCSINHGQWRIIHRAPQRPPHLHDKGSQSQYEPMVLWGWQMLASCNPHSLTKRSHTCVPQQS